MYYTSKDICKFFNIKRDTLRHYESMGIIHPHINPDNQYRYYDEWDIYAISECKKYQTLGMSLKDISTLQNHGTLNKLLLNTEALQNVLEERSRYYTLLADKNKQYIIDLKRIEQDLNCCYVTEIPTTYFFPIIHDKNIFTNEIILETGHFALKNYAFFENGLHVSLNDYKNNTNIFTWGHLINQYYADIINAPVHLAHKLSTIKVIRCLIDAGERGNFTYKLFHPIFEYADKHNLNIADDIFGILLTRVHGKNGYCRYFDIYLPVE